jgi:hypothetical protein
MSKEQSNLAEDLEFKNIIEPQLNIILTTDEDDERPVYISGNFNNWVTQDKKFEMERVGQGLYHFKFEHPYLSGVDDKEVYFRVPLDYHAGLIVKCDNNTRVRELLDNYVERLIRDFATVAQKEAVKKLH